jgi:uncharacterized membrane protein
MKKLLFLALSASVLFVSCKKEETPDTQKPVITVITPASDHIDLEPGDMLNLAALLTDNEELLNAKVDIHEAGNHSHKVTGEGWEWAKVYVISGKEFNLTESIQIPADAEHGEYHITFEATDKAGNAATPVVIELHID